MPRATPLSADERRAAIMAATEPLLEAYGRNVSTRQIASAACVAEGTIFRVFPSKDALIDAVIAEAFDASVTCGELANIGLNGDLEHRLVQAVTLLQDRLRRVFALFHSLALVREPQSHQEMRAKQAHDNRLLDAALARLLEPDASVLRYPPEDAASLLRAITFSVTHPVLSDQRHADPTCVVDLLLHGVVEQGALRGCGNRSPSC